MFRTVPLPIIKSLFPSDDGQRNKFGKLVHLVGFIIKKLVLVLAACNFFYKDSSLNMKYENC